MNVNNLTIQDNAYPSVLRDIPSPPEELYYLGAPPADWIEQPRVAIVGSRAVTERGREVTLRLAGELAGQGIVIIGGLALGVDGIAHQACLDAGGTTVAVLASGLDKVSPAHHRDLAKHILEQDGTLMSEYRAGT